MVKKKLTAVLSIKKTAKIKPEDLAKIANWLRREIDFLYLDGCKRAKNYRSHFYINRNL